MFWKVRPSTRAEAPPSTRARLALAGDAVEDDAAGLARDIGDPALILHRAHPVGAGRDHDGAVAAADRGDRLAEIVIGLAALLDGERRGARIRRSARAAARRRRGCRPERAGCNRCGSSPAPEPRAGRCRGVNGVNRRRGPGWDGADAKASIAASFQRKLESLCLFRHLIRQSGIPAFAGMTGWGGVRCVCGGS